MPNPYGYEKSIERNATRGYIGEHALFPHQWHTQLSPEEEALFRQQVMSGGFGRIPVAEILAANSDYDYRGFYKALKEGDPRATSTINPNDKELHFPDIWKTPMHMSFSAESQYANPETAPRWNEKDQLIDPKTGEVMFDEKEFVKTLKGFKR